MALSYPIIAGLCGLVEVMYMFNADSKERILVVEDEADILQILCLYLQYSGFEVRGVKNGQEAIQLVTEFRPQLIVLDLMMQPVSGWEVLDWLHANRITPPLPVLVITALNHLTEQVRGFEEGAIDYMTKPTQPGLIVERIRTILSLTPEQRMMLRHQHMDEKRRVLERLNTPQPDEFTY
ncbi:MAG TPA: response regulator [Ktedonobacteraceae bacterium]|nr:response regulator [Ktedonobacteraceae bacterium]